MNLSHFGRWIGELTKTSTTSKLQRWSAALISLKWGDFPFQKATFWGEVLWGRYNLTRFYKHQRMCTYRKNCTSITYSVYSKILIFQTYSTHLYASRIYTTLGKVVYFTTWIPQGFNPQGPGNVAQRFKIGSKRSTVAWDHRRIDGRNIPSPGHRIGSGKSRNFRAYNPDP